MAAVKAATAAVQASATKGPWRVEWPEHSDAMSEVFAKVGDDSRWRVAYVMRDSNPHQRPVDDANARLIAAAPELADALRALANAYAEQFSKLELKQDGAFQAACVALVNAGWHSR